MLTLKAAKRLEAAEVVLHDALISEDVLAMVPAGAELINVGKRCGDVKDRGMQQQEIHDLMLLHGSRGRRVVRLKCGDPYVFARGGEEVEFLAEHGIPFEVVPGVTSVLGASASCSVPLTHRSFGVNHVRFVVGQSKAKCLPELDWAEIARDAMKQTTVFYMGYKSLDKICETLRENNAPEHTPMVLVESATMPAERAVHGTLATMPDIAKQSNIGETGPVLFLMGPTAAFPAHLEKLAGGRPLKRLRPGVIGAACHPDGAS